MRYRLRYCKTDLNCVHGTNLRVFALRNLFNSQEPRATDTESTKTDGDRHPLAQKAAQVHSQRLSVDN
jgi:hypothetical protein